MTKFFLKSGAGATAKHVAFRSLYDSLLPIDIALLAVRRRVLWSKEDSLFSLIVELTGEGMVKKAVHLSENRILISSSSVQIISIYNISTYCLIKDCYFLFVIFGIYRQIEPNKTLRLLVNELSESEVSEVICHYVAEAKMIELVNLLIVCSERSIMVDNLYMSSSFVSSRDWMTLRQYVVNQIVLLENKVRKLVENDNAKLAEYRVMKESMMTMLMLLEIFLRTGDKITKVAGSLLYMPFLG